MNKTIEITIKDKVARQSNKTNYVCGNSDFIIDFVFDEEWDECSVKTARFKHSAGYTDVVFEGNKCPVPIISNTHNIYIGVFAGNLLTTTSAHVGAKKSILCDGGIPTDPSPDVYAQIIKLLDDMSKRIQALEESGTNQNKTTSVVGTAVVGQAVVG